MIPIISFSADYYTMAPGDAQMIDEHGLCRGVANNTSSANPPPAPGVPMPPGVYPPSGLTIFIPTKTAEEWTEFVNHPPPGIVVEDCCAKSCT
ncbi:MAG: hypothetical protein KDD33_13215 [Bdellovibrionales bacterium]|nr:hypothetical protein [Bdellovibrionales bacterium]